jgi:hypothetical protein
MDQGIVLLQESTVLLFKGVGWSVQDIEPKTRPFLISKGG